MKTISGKLKNWTLLPSTLFLLQFATDARAADAPPPCTFALSSTTATHHAGTSTGLVSVTTAAGCSWSVANTNSWLSILSGANGTNNGLVRYFVTANATAFTRSGYLLIADQWFAVTQLGSTSAPPCAFSISPSNGTHSSASSTGLVSVSTSAGCSWTVANTNAWVAIESGASGSGNGLVRYLLTENSGAPRSGNLLVAGQLFTITQLAPPSFAGPTFTNVTATVMPGLAPNGSNIAWGDYDNDGRLDLFIGGYYYDGDENYYSQIWRNTGSGFTNVTATVAPGLLGLGAASGSAAWGDYDNDGRLDLLFTGLIGMEVESSRIFRNTGTGFVDVTTTVAPGLPGVESGSVAWGDYDNDGRLDFLITGFMDNGDGTETRSQLWRNTGNGFKNVTATVTPGLPQVWAGSVAWADFDNDGRLDFLITGTDYVSEGPISQLWRNTGNGFVNVTAALAPGLPQVAVGSAVWADYDNDGRMDFLITGITAFDNHGPSARACQLWRNTGSGFTNVTATVAPGLLSATGSRVAWGDYDNDGRIDFFLTGSGLWRNTASGFTNVTASAGLLPFGTATWADFDNDGRLDFFAGSSQLWRNNTPITNTPPAVTTKPPTSVSQNSVTLNGSINPHQQTAMAWFIWGDSTNYDHVTAAQPMSDGGSFINFSQAITGLSTGVTYHYRAVGSNVQGQVALGVEQRFIFAPPVVTTRPIEYFRSNSAMLNAHVSPNNLPTYGWFEWGLTPAYGATTPVLLLGGFDAMLSQNLSGLEVGTTYYFRAVVSNGLSTVYGAAQSFVEPDITAVCPGSITPTVRIHGNGGGSGYSVNVYFACNWSVINPNSWIIITSAANGSGNGIVTYALTPNTNSLSRNGTITIGGQDLLVTQAGGAPVSGCYVFITPGSNDRGYGAAIGTVNVGAAPDCAWDVVNTNSWITIVSGSNGVGAGQVVYAIDGNPDMESRSGSFTIGGRIHTIRQYGHSQVSLPADQVVALGGTATFSVTVTNITPPFTCQWQFNGVDLVDDGGIGGAKTSTLVLTGVQYSQAGHYRCVVSNAYGYPYFSSSATLTVAPTSNALSIAEALDTEDMFFWKTWSDSSGIWFGQTNTTHEGVDALECSGLSQGEFASVEAKSGGPGILSFWWKTSFAAPSDRLLFWIGSWQAAMVPTTRDWEQRTFTVPPGDVDLQWTFANSSTGEQSKAWVDQVQFTPCDFRLPDAGRFVPTATSGTIAVTAAADCPWHVVNTNSWITILSSVTNHGSGLVIYAVAPNPTPANRVGYLTIADQSYFLAQGGGNSSNPAISLPEALDTEGSLTWSTIGTPEWFGQNIVSRDGADAAQSGPVGDSAAVTATTTVNGPGTVLFWWRVSSETNKDYLKFFINGVQQTRISGEVDWQLLSYNLFSGTNVLKWTYSKNNDVAVGQDRGWLDQVQFVPTPATGLCGVAVSPISATHSGNSETGFVSVVIPAGCGWDVVNTNSWITDVGGPSAGNGFVRYTVSANNSRNQRTGVLLIGGRPFTVTQLNGLPSCSYSISATGISHGSVSGSGTVTVTTPSDCQWNVFNTNAWITITSSLSNSGNGTVNYSVAQNTSFVTRSGQVRIGDQILTISQSGATLTLAEALDTVGTSLAWTSGDLSGNWQWSGQASVTHDGVDAARSAPITQTGASSILKTTVSGPGTLTFWWKTSAKPPYDGLHFFIEGPQLAFIGGESDWQQQTFAVSAGLHELKWIYWHDGASSGNPGQDCGWVDQVQFVPNPGCAFTISPGNPSHPSTYSTGAVSVVATTGCAWSVLNTNSWISIVSGSNGTGNGTVIYSVAANPTASVRSGNVRIADKLLFVTQSGTPPPCSIAISPASRAHGFGSATGTVSVTTQAGCWWWVSNSNAWVTVVSPSINSSNSGSGQVIYSVSENTTPFARSGNLHIGGQLFSISQSAAPDTNLVITLPEALDTVGTPLVWTTSGNGPWFGQVAASHDGVDAAQSGTVPDSANSSLQTVVSGPGTLTFWWKVSSESNNDTLRFYVNGVEQSRISGEVDWQQRTIAVAAGSQALEWRYGKNASIAAGQDRGWVDQVQYVPNSGCTISLSPTSASHGSGSSTGIVGVTAWGCAWGVVNTNTWVSIVSGTSTNGAGSGTLVYTVAANASPSARSGNIRIGSENFLITQLGIVTNCTFSISPSSRSHGMGNATGTVSVTTQSGCAWSVIETNSWISILSSLNNSSSGIVIYSLAPNTNSQVRSGVIRIDGQNFTVTQSGTSVTASNAPRIQFMSRTGNVATLSVQGETGRMYVVECSEDLIHWIPISTNSAPAAVTDVPVGNAPRRFYRTVEIP
jgi:hypothetical protein